MKSIKTPLARVMAASALLSILAFAAHAHAYKIGAIEIGHPWTRATPKGADSAAGYFTIENNGGTSDTLIGVTMMGAKSSTIHEMATSGGKMTMTPIPELSIPAGKTVKLAPGELHHIMFEGLKKPLKEGDKISGTLVFKDAGAVDIYWKVEKMGAKAPAAMPGMKMDGHGH
jgi:copper(I)-binding protein